MLFNTFRHLQHFLVHSHLERVIGEIADFTRRQIDNALQLGIVAAFLCGKQVIYRGQQTGYAVFRQSPSPPVPKSDRLPPLSLAVHGGKYCDPPY